MSACNGCGAPLRWVKTAAFGRPMPLDPEPNPAGNVAVVADARGGTVAVVLAGAALDLARESGTVLYMPHHAVCPKVEQFRGRS